MDNHLQLASNLANLLDSQFGIGKFRFGLSALFDLIPGLGDIIDVLLSLYIVWVGIEMQVPSSILAQMIGNIVLNFILGLIPLFGDVVYFIRKVNLKNVELLKQYATSSHYKPLQLA